jgi:hypothetical protein
MTILHNVDPSSRWEPPSEKIVDLSGLAVTESWCCVDCGVDTAPGTSNRGEIEEAYKSADYDEDNVGTICYGGA